MQKYFSKNAKSFQSNLRVTSGVLKNPQDKAVNRFQQNASRLEHCNVRNKNKGKKG